MQNKTYKLLSILLGILVLAIILFFIFQGNKKQEIIKTDKGNVPVNNPAKLPGAKSLSGGGYNFKENANYSIDYYSQDSGFVVVILSPDIQAARDMAEKDFLETLTINKEDACKLKVSLAVPFSVNENASGTNYHLSFCPDGKAFPK